MELFAERMISVVAAFRESGISCERLQVWLYLFGIDKEKVYLKDVFVHLVNKMNESNIEC